MNHRKVSALQELLKVIKDPQFKVYSHKLSQQDLFLEVTGKMFKFLIGEAHL
jgi:hypothetical protein